MKKSVLEKRIKKYGISQTLDSLSCEEISMNYSVLLSCGVTLKDLVDNYEGSYYFMLEDYEKLIKCDVSKNELDEMIIATLNNDECYEEMEFDELEEFIKKGVDAKSFYDLIMAKELNSSLVGSFHDLCLFLYDQGITAEQIKKMMDLASSESGIYAYTGILSIVYKPRSVPYKIFEFVDDYTKMGIDCSDYLEKNIDWIIYDMDNWNHYDLKYEVLKLPEQMRGDAVRLFINKGGTREYHHFDCFYDYDRESNGDLDGPEDFVGMVKKYGYLKDFAIRIKEITKSDKDCNNVHYLAYNIFKEDQGLMDAKTVVEYMMRAFKDDEDAREEWYGWLLKDGVDTDIIRCLIEKPN